MSETAPQNNDSTCSKLLQEPIHKHTTCRTSDEEHNGAKIGGKVVLADVASYPSVDAPVQVEKRQAQFFERSAYHHAPDASAIPFLN
jgi:hypothetical protein